MAIQPKNKELALWLGITAGVLLLLVLVIAVSWPQLKKPTVDQAKKSTAGQAQPAVAGASEVTPRSPLGVNLEMFNYWSVNQPFKNVMSHFGGSWAMLDNNWTVTTTPALQLDADGYPMAIPSGVMRLQSFILLGTGGHYPAGTYVMLFDGDAKLSFDPSFDAKSFSTTTANRYVIQIPNPSSLGIKFYITKINPNDHPRNMRLMELQYENNYQSQPYRQEFLDFLQDFSVVRYMNWMGSSDAKAVTTGAARGGTGGTWGTANTITLSATASSQDDYYVGMAMRHRYPGRTDQDRRYITDYDGATKVATIGGNWSVEVDPRSRNFGLRYTPLAGDEYAIAKFPQKDWADRSLLSHIGFKKSGQGVPVEILVDLANRAGVSPWFTLPTEVSDDYMTQFATYVRDHLNPDLKAYIEYGNENWNSGYVGYLWTVALGAQRGIRGWDYTSMRSVRMFKIFDDVFSQPYTDAFGVAHSASNEAHLRSQRSGSRLVRILPCQNGGSAPTECCNAIMNYDGSGLQPSFQDESPFIAGTTAADYADVLAIAPYYSVPDAASDLRRSVTNLIAIMQGNVNKHYLSNGTVYLNVENARKHGLNTVAYEVGQEMTATEATLNKLKEVNRDQGMYNLYKSDLEQWKSLSSTATSTLGTRVWVHFQDTTVISKYGAWGLREYMGQPMADAPKWRAVHDFAVANNPAWWTDVFPGGTSPADTTAPITSISPAAGTYTSAQTITLASEPGATTYYCLTSNCTPTTVYSAPISITSSQTVRYRSIDTAGNTETIKTANYTIVGTTPPSPIPVPPPPITPAPTPTSTPPLTATSTVPLASSDINSFLPGQGRLVKQADSSGVYYVTGTSTRHLFTNEQGFFSWFSGSWRDQQVSIISSADFAKLQVSNNATVRPGTNLVRFIPGRAVYAVAPGPKLCPITNPGAAQALYGANWTGRIIALFDASFIDYTLDNTCTIYDGSHYPNGTFLRYVASSTLWYIENGQQHAVSTAAFNRQKFRSEFIIIDVPVSKALPVGALLP